MGKKSKKRLPPPKAKGAPKRAKKPRSSYAKPSLVFAPAAWTKLKYLCHLAEGEVSGFGLAMDPTRPLYIHDIALVDQESTSLSTDMSDDGVADHYDRCSAAGLHPAQCGRVWIHTHPSSDAGPSRQDYDTLRQALGGQDWAVMMILARGGQTSCLLRSNVGPAVETEIDVLVAWHDVGSYGTDVAKWAEEYAQRVTEKKITHIYSPGWSWSNMTPHEQSECLEQWELDELELLGTAGY